MLSDSILFDNGRFELQWPCVRCQKLRIFCCPRIQNFPSTTTIKFSDQGLRRTNIQFGTQIDVLLAFDGLREVLAIVMKNFTRIWQILTDAPEKNREAFSRPTIWTELDSARFCQNFCAERHI